MKTDTGDYTVQSGELLPFIMVNQLPSKHTQLGHSGKTEVRLG